MFQQPNEFIFNAETGKSYVIYFLKFWQESDDYIVKYQIRTTDREIFWFGRMSKERAFIDLNINSDNIKTISKEDLDKKIKEHLMMLFTTVMKKGLNKGFEEPDTEFIFYKEPFVTKRIWKE
jgi:hypothetical protein